METQEQSTNRPWLFKKGQSGNPGGRPKGTKSLKERAREYLAGLSDEEAYEYFDGLNKLDVWKMAEGMPQTNTDITTGGEKIIPLLNYVQNRDNDSDTKDTEPKQEN